MCPTAKLPPAVSHHDDVLVALLHKSLVALVELEHLGREGVALRSEFVVQKQNRGLLLYGRIKQMVDGHDRTKLLRHGLEEETAAVQEEDNWIIGRSVWLLDEPDGVGVIAFTVTWHILGQSRSDRRKDSLNQEVIGVWSKPFGV